MSAGLVLQFIYGLTMGKKSTVGGTKQISFSIGNPARIITPFHFYFGRANCLRMATAIPRMITPIAKRSQTIMIGEASASATLVALTRIMGSSSVNLGLVVSSAACTN